MPSNAAAPDTGGEPTRRRGLTARPALTDGVVALDRLGPADAVTITAACSDTETQRWLPLPSPYTVADAMAYVRRQDDAWAADTSWIFAVRRTDRHHLVGSVGVHLQSPGVMSLGYWTVPDHRRHGYASRAVRLAAAFTFDCLSAQRVEIVVDERNLTSCATARRAGARESGTRSMPAGGGRHVTAVVHVLTRTERG